jgi:hypothetical protein
MSTEPRREIVIEAELDEAYDGILRILGDSERSGFELRELALAEASQGSRAAIVTLGVPVSADLQLIAARFSRHPAVRRAVAREGKSQAVARPRPVLEAA